MFFFCSFCVEILNLYLFQLVSSQDDGDGKEDPNRIAYRFPHPETLAMLKHVGVRSPQ